jgi:hypothetical protein
VAALVDAWPEAARERDRTGKLPLAVALDARPAAEAGVLSELLARCLPGLRA